MKKILCVFIIFFSIKGYAQNTTPQFLGNANSNLIVQGIMNLADSPKASFNFLLPDTTTAKTYFSSKLKGRWARQNGRLYFNPSGLKFMLADSVTSGGGGNVDSNVFATVSRLADTSNVLRGLIGTGGLDTTSLSNRINARVKYTDTASMLANYAKSQRLIDTALAIQGRINAKVGYADTAAMLTPYPLTSELTNQSGTDGSLKSLHITGTSGLGHIHLRHQSVDATSLGSSTVLFSDANGDLKWKNDGNFYTTFRDFRNTADRVYTFQNKSYTVGDSADIVTKLNIVDTANRWITNVFRKVATDSVFYTKGGTNIYAYKDSVGTGGGGSGTVTSISTTNGTGITGGTITSTGTLAIDTTIVSTRLWRQKAVDSLNANIALRVRYSDTATMLTPYLRKGDTTAMLGGYLRKVDTSTLSNRINLKANIASPTFTGTVTIPTGANITTPNILSLTSGTTNDSIVVADATSGALKRISSSRIGGGGGGSGWNLTGNSGTTAGTNFVGTTDAVDLWFKRNNVIGGYISSTSTALGNEATFTYQAASNVTAIGAGALRANLNSNNTAVGQDAARGNTTGSNNTALGMSALYSNTGNSNSTAIGYFAGLQSTGASNIFVGASAGFATTSASKSIVISASGELASNTTANQVNLGNVIWASDASGTSNTPLGRVSIGTNTPNARALLELSNAGTTKGGFKLSTFTTTERDAISWVSGDAGMMIWNSTTTKAQVWTGSAWADLH